MRSGTVFKAGDLLPVPFPFTDLSSSKRRPVLALTAPDDQGDFIACPVTSRSRWVAAQPLLPADMVTGNLPRPSWVRTDHVVTLHQGLVVKQFGTVAEAYRVSLVDDLCRVLRSDPTV